MNYINNWLHELTTAFSPDTAELPVPADALTRLQLAEGVVYTLTLAAEIGTPDPDATEIINVVGAAGGGYSLARGQEGTSEQNWPAGTLIFAGVTAGMLAGLAVGGSDSAEISKAADNQIEQRPDGLFVPPHTWQSTDW